MVAFDLAEGLARRVIVDETLEKSEIAYSALDLGAGSRLNAEGGGGEVYSACSVGRHHIDFEDSLNE